MAKPRAKWQGPAPNGQTATDCWNHCWVPWRTSKQRHAVVILRRRPFRPGNASTRGQRGLTHLSRFFITTLSVGTYGSCAAHGTKEIYCNGY